MINGFICVQANVLWLALDLCYVTLLPASGKQHYKYKSLCYNSYSSLLSALFI